MLDCSKNEGIILFAEWKTSRIEKEESATMKKRIDSNLRYKMQCRDDRRDVQWWKGGTMKEKRQQI